MSRWHCKQSEYGMSCQRTTIVTFYDVVIFIYCVRVHEVNYLFFSMFSIEMIDISGSACKEPWDDILMGIGVDSAI